MDQLNQAKDMAIQQQDYGRAAEIREQQAGLREEITRLESNWLLERGAEQLAIGEEDIAQIVSLWTGIPAMRIEQEESQRLLHMEEALHERLVGQNEAIEKIARAVRRARAGLKDPKRPIGSFIFMGPTGVGKTELARTLAEFMFGSEEALFKFDMSEFMERHAAARLVGAPPGYVGYEEGGQLTEAVRRKPYCVILLDEMEKAHPEVFNMLLQVLEDGKLTDAKGRTVDFRNTILIMTSNIGASLLNKQAAIGFRQTGNKTLAAQADYEHMKSKVLVELKNGFKPEFLNRIDEVIVFHSLGIEELYTIIDILLKRIRLQLSEHELTLEIPAATKDFLIAKGFDPEYGARPLRRTIQRMIEDQLAECLLQGKFQPGDIVECLIVDDQLVLQVKNRSKGLLQLAS
jgi:ATP-dependent Clp protease ATP-binding subunit ClpC